MAPSIVASFIDKTKERLKALTVGCVNLGFCFPYWMKLVQGGHTPEKAMQILNPESLIVMYLGAGLGYLLEWICVYISVTLTQKKNKSRLKSIEKEKQHLTEKWGVEVTGNYPVDEHGFLIKTDEAKPAV
ncbi:MAG: hypothetical protein CL565_01175 [Alphaproteobacteria bacterium]|nr:hypothetical protein [Alphaproteobacteria bacterium]